MCVKSEALNNALFAHCVRDPAFKAGFKGSVIDNRTRAAEGRHERLRDRRNRHTKANLARNETERTEPPRLEIRRSIRFRNVELDCN